MNKLSYILISGILLLLLVIGATLYLKQQKTTTPTTPVATYTDFNIFLKNIQGENISVANFLKNKDVTLDTQNPGLYSLGSVYPANPTTNNLPDYVATYEEKSGYFNITLLKKPLANSRKEAEVYIKNLLKLDESQICKLSYMVSVPGYVDADASGIDYRFSFCSDAVQL